MNFHEMNWRDPPREYCANPLIHQMPEENRTTLMDAVKDFGFGGVVTNPSWKNWYGGYEENIREFENIIRELEERGLSFWIYDEKGYPSGFAGGEVLKGHPELEAKGFYMRRVVAYEPRHIKYQLDFESDKIIWAAKYPMECPGMHESFVQYDRMISVPFTDTFCETDLGEKESFYVFCVKSAYEGTHCTHNVSSFSRYINVMDPKAVRRFIDVMLEPIAKIIPDVFARATAVFTDEPALCVAYSRSYESWPYAMAPWVDGLFEAYEREYGQSLLPMLPLLFEGNERGIGVRINFYRLVGMLIGKAYVTQLTQWCKAHGGVFSGHYLGEEHILGHVRDYGSYIETVKCSEYPGLDVLQCYPESFNYDTVKYPQMAARKAGAKGLMAELCPFYNQEEFAKAPLDNMMAVTGLLYMFGVRHCNSYFSSNFQEYDPEKLSGRTGYMSREDARRFNGYLGRMRVMLDGLENDCGLFVYYGLEDCQAKYIPQHYGSVDDRRPESDMQVHTQHLSRTLLESGHDFYYADCDDLVQAAAESVPSISGHPVKMVVVPPMDVMYDASYHALLALEQKGVAVFFLEKVPAYGNTGFRRQTPDFTPVTVQQVLEIADGAADFRVEAGESCIVKARFIRDGEELWMVSNNTRQPVEAVLTHKNRTSARIFNPEDGSVESVQMEKPICLPALRSVFVVMGA